MMIPIIQKSNEGLIKCLVLESKQKGWVSARSALLLALRETMIERGFDLSDLMGKNKGLNTFAIKGPLKIEGMKVSRIR